MAFQRGSGFVGLQQYLAANQGAAQQLGGAVAGRVGAAEQAARGAVDQASAQFNAAAGAATPAYLEPTTSEQAVRAGGAATYKGPKVLGDVADMGTLQGQLAGAGQVGTLASTDAGRATLLQQQYGQGYTSQGGRGLDAFLAGRGGGSQLAGSAGSLARLQAYLSGAQGQAMERAAQGQVAAQGVQQQYAGWRPTPVMAEPRRNVIETPGTTPEAPRRESPFTRLGRRLFGGG